MKSYPTYQNALIAAVLFFAGIAAAPAHAELIAYDQFVDYTDGGIGGQGEGFGWGGNNWFSGNSGGDLPIVSNSVNLSYGTLITAGGGGLAGSGATGDNAYFGRDLATQITTAGTNYFGFLLQQTGSANAKHNYLRLQAGNGHWIGAGSWNSSSKWRLIRYDGSYADVDSGVSETTGVTYFVIKLVFDDGGDEIAYLYVNPANAAALSGSADASYTFGNQWTTIKRVQGALVTDSSSGTMTFDEIRVGNAPADMFDPVDQDPPTADFLSPTNGAVNVSVAADLQITFSEEVEAGSGDIVIREVSGGTPFETIAVTSAAVTVSSSNVTINPVGVLGTSTNYWVEITNGVIQDLSGNPFAGITNDSDWAFTTVSAGQIVITTADADNISNVTARLNATLDCPGTNATVIAYWWQTGSGTTNSFTNAPYSDETAFSVSHTASGLSSKTAYSFTFRATNATDDIWANSTNTFTTHDIPEVSNGSGPSLRWAALTGWTTVTLNGAITATNGVPATNVRIYFGDNNPGAETAAGWDITNDFPSVAGAEAFSTNITDLLYEKTYYYTVYASNAYGSAWSAVTNITTGRALWFPTNFTAEAWYDAADENKITLSSGNVSQWQDVSGNGNHASQSSPTARPSTGNDIGGLNALGFDGDNYRLDTSLEQLTTCTIFVVAEPSANGASHASLVLSAASGFDAGGLYLEMENYSNSDPKFNIRYGAVIAGSQKSYNGEVAASPSVFQQGIFAHWGSGFSTENEDYKIGNRPDNWNSGHYKGTIGEIIIIPSVLSDDNRQKVEGYLAHKWGLEDELPTGHTYKANPPYASDRGGTLFRFR